MDTEVRFPQGLQTGEIDYYPLGLNAKVGPSTAGRFWPYGTVGWYRSWNKGDFELNGLSDHRVHKTSLVGLGAGFDYDAGPRWALRFEGLYSSTFDDPDADEHIRWKGALPVASRPPSRTNTIAEVSMSNRLLRTMALAVRGRRHTGGGLRRQGARLLRHDRRRPHPLTGDIFGRVTVDGSPRSGVTVTVRQGNTVIDTEVTDQNGEYEFLELDPGTYTVSIGTITGADCPGEQTAVVEEDERPSGTSPARRPSPRRARDRHSGR